MICFSVGDATDSPIHYEVYFCVDGDKNIRESFLKDFGVKISFKKDVNLLHEIPESYFWIVAEKDFQYILEEPREI